jgi:hypothetical protein
MKVPENVRLLIDEATHGTLAVLADWFEEQGQMALADSCRKGGVRAWKALLGLHDDLCRSRVYLNGQLVFEGCRLNLSREYLKRDGRTTQRIDVEIEGSPREHRLGNQRITDAVIVLDDTFYVVRPEQLQTTNDSIFGLCVRIAGALLDEGPVTAEHVA